MQRRLSKFVVQPEELVSYVIKKMDDFNRHQSGRLYRNANFSLPAEGLDIYHEAMTLHQASLSHENQTIGRCTCCAERRKPYHERVVLHSPSCHTLLFHGKYAPHCLAERNITRADLPCVGKLFVTATGGSGTLATADRLNAAGYAFESEDHVAETDVLVSWISRTDAWRLQLDDAGGALHKAGYAFDPRLFRPYSGYNPLGVTSFVTHRALSRCLYRKVLLQVREPLATIASILVMATGGAAGVHVIADQLVAQSGVFSSACDIPVMPTLPMSIGHVNRPGLRNAHLAYAAHHWWSWMTAALTTADAWYPVEGTNLSTICTLGGLDAARCARVDADSSVQVHRNHHNVHGGSHGRTTAMTPVTWSELCGADAGIARRTHALAERFGYGARYDAADVANASWCLWSAER